MQDIEGVTSHSIGSNIERRVVITPEEGAYRKNDNRRGGGRKGGGNRNRSQSAPAAAGENREPKKDLSSAPLYGIVTKADNDSEDA